MAVTEQFPITSALANGVTTVFPFGWTLLSADDMVVQSTVGGVTTTYPSSAYTISGIGLSSGSVTFSAAPASGVIITMYRDTALVRETDYQDNGDLLADTVNLDFDRLWMAMQDILTGGKASPSAIRVPNGETVNVLPLAASRAGYYLGFDATGEPSLLLAATGTAAALASDLASSSDAAKGDALVAVKRVAASGASATTQHQYNEHAHITATVDFAVPNDGTTSATSAIQAMFNACAAAGVKEIYFPPGTYKLTNPNNDTAFTCAVVISGLKQCRVYGASGTKFIVGTGGAGSSEFGFFRIEQCEDVEFSNFEMDGSGITINGTGGNRSCGFIGLNFDANTNTTDLAVANKRLHFHHIYAHDMGGFISIQRRSQTLAVTPQTLGLSVHDCRAENLLGVDHGVGCPYTSHAHIYNNRFYNDISTVTPQDNMAFDASSGAVDVLIENNYVYGFVFGGKCETATGAGPGGSEIRPSFRVRFLNNYLEEIGDPALLEWPGPSGGGIYGLKLNGRDCVASGNTILARTVDVTTGGLGYGLIVVNTHTQDSHCVIDANRIKGADYGILHNDTTPTTRECTVVIRDNRLDDCTSYGILAQANCIVSDNHILRAGKSAIICQTPNNSFFRRNIAIDCATTDNGTTTTRVVFFQDGSGAHSGIQEWTDNVILDSRGASAAEHGYYLQGGTTRTNALIFRPGYQSGLLTGVTFDRYFSIIGDSLQIEGTTDRPPVTFRSSAVPSSTSPWSSLAWKVGDRALREVQTAGQPKAWVCTTAGTPGTWTSEGNL